jgi:glycosyltransferase involved in cell wall biosynthesis
MKVMVTSEHRFLRTPDGAVWTAGVNSFSFWARYLEAFDAVKVIARVREHPAAPEGWRPASGPNIEFAPIPYYIGTGQYLLVSRDIQRTLARLLEPDSAVILRVSSQIAACTEACLSRIQKPYGLEVVNDPYDVYRPGSVRHVARPLLRWHYTRQLRRLCGGAAAVAYVTSAALQARYHTPAFAVGVSDVEIGPEAFVDNPRRIEKSYPAPRLITVGALEQRYKATDVLIRSVADCRQSGLGASLEILGDGRLRANLERLTANLGLERWVSFRGQIPHGDGVRKFLDSADIFVLPSRCEGLPRAMLEAMARALPCIGSDVGGIPELLHAEDLVRPGDVSCLSQRIREVASSPQRMCEMSARNLITARGYREDALASRHQAFLGEVKEATVAWRSRTGRDLSVHRRELERAAI